MKKRCRSYELAIAKLETYGTVNRGDHYHLCASPGCMSVWEKAARKLGDYQKAVRCV